MLLHPRLSLLRHVLLTGTLIVAVQPPASNAQVTTALTPSGLNTRISEPTTLPSGRINYDITGGTRPSNGPNLFHSFGEFSIATNEIANFLNETRLPTSNIISRVSDGNVSNIWGTIQTTYFGTANLYLINPAGIMFGPTAELNVGGAFAASTADYLRLTDGARVHADLARPSTLSIAPVEAFGFTVPRPVAISVQGSTLQVASNQTLSVVGGDITMAGGSLLAPSGRIDLASVASAGEVIPNSTGSPPDLQVESFSQLGRIDLSQNAFIDAGGDNGGTVVVRGGQLRLNSSADILASTKGPAVGGAVGDPGAGVDVQVTEEIVLDSGSVIGTNVFQNVAPGVGSGGVRLKADHVEIANFSDVESVVFFGSTGGKSGDVTVDANSVLIRDGGFVRVNTGGSADGGALILKANENLEFRNGGLAFTLAFAGSGNAGDILVNANDILLTGAPGVITAITSQTGTGGNAGDVNVTAQNLRLLGNATFISTPTFGPGQGGNLDVNVAGDLFMSGNAANPFNTGLFATSFGTGKAGNLNISADNITFVNRARAQATTSGPGDAGNVTVRTGSLELRDGSSIASSVFGTGKGGMVDVTAETILIAGVSNSTNPLTGGDFTALSTFTNSGPGGDMRIAADNVTVTDKGQITSVSRGPGAAGDITLQLEGSLELTNGGQIISNAVGSGPGGNIEISAPQNVLIAGVNPVPIIEPQLGRPVLMVSGIGSQYASAAQGGSAGNIQIMTGNLQILDGGKVSADTFGPGNGGNITVTADSVRVAGVSAQLRDFLISKGQDPIGAGSGIQASSESAVFGNAATGKAGDVNVTAGDVEVHPGGLVFARTTGPGAGGNIAISAPSFLMNAGIVSAETRGSGNAGNVTVEAGNATLTGGALISSTTFGSGKGGKVTVAAGESLMLLGETPAPVTIGGVTFSRFPSSIFTAAFADGQGGRTTVSAPALTMQKGAIAAQAFGSGDAGEIVVDAGRLALTEGALISATTTGAGQGGNVTVRATDSITIDGNRSDVFLGAGLPIINAPSGFFTNAHATGDGGMISVSTPVLTIGADKGGGEIGAQTFGPANAGSILVEVGSLTLANGATISGTTFGAGKGGNVIVSASDSISISGRHPGSFGVGSVVFKNSQSSIVSLGLAEGKAGRISVSTADLSIHDEGIISAATGGAGAAGDVAVNTGALSLASGGQISSSSGVRIGDTFFAGNGAGGTVTVNANGPVAISGQGSGLFTSAVGNGPGGNINLQGSAIDLTKGASISATSSGLGDAGNITINSGNQFLMTNSSVTTQATQASGGNIQLAATNMIRLRESQVTASVFGGPTTRGGDIMIDPNFVILQNSQIIAQAFQGQGGNINIVAGLVLADPNSLVSASSQRGVSGSVNIQAPVQNLSGALVPLPQNYLEAAALLAQRCAARMAGGSFSSFVVTEQGGLPRAPGGLVPSPFTASEGASMGQMLTEPVLLAWAGDPLASWRADAPVQLRGVPRVCWK